MAQDRRGVVRYVYGFYSGFVYNRKERLRRRKARARAHLSKRRNRAR